MSERSDSQLHVRLVDDNPTFVENLAEILQGQGYAVESAGTCASALQRTRIRLFDIVVELSKSTGDIAQPREKRLSFITAA